MNEAAKAKTIVELEWEIDWLKEQIALRDGMLDNADKEITMLRQTEKRWCKWLDQDEALIKAVKAYCEGTGGSDDYKLHDQLVSAYLAYRADGGGKFL
jgi:predicted kinase